MARDSCIQHRPHTRLAIIRDDYLEVAGDTVSAAIVGLFHQWWCTGQDTSATPTEIESSLLGIAKEKAIRKYVAALVIKQLLVQVLPSADEVRALVIHRRTGGLMSQLSSCGRFRACVWCSATAAIMHDHHYPVKASDGGKETVSICPSCHADYHALADSQIVSPSKSLIDIFEAWPHAFEGV